MSNNKLNNAPLKEVLLEIHWDLDFSSDEKIYIDKGFEQAALNFTSACQQEFKEVELLKPENMPPSAFIHRVTHRFFKVRGQHPLFQLGPGVFTINDNDKNYVWDEFKPMVINGIKCLNTSYNKPLVPSKVELRYVDRVSPYVLGNEDKFQFIKEHLSINPDHNGLLTEYLNLDQTNIRRSYNISEDKQLNLTILTGIDGQSKEDVVEWHTFINNKKRLSWDNLPVWIEESHDICSDLFKKMVSKKLYEYFSS